MTTDNVTRHGLTRSEWVRRFKAHIVKRADLDPKDAKGVPEAELESWPEHETRDESSGDGEWVFWEPELAADENLSAWSE